MNAVILDAGVRAAMEKAGHRDESGIKLRRSRE